MDWLEEFGQENSAPAAQANGNWIDDFESFEPEKAAGGMLSPVTDLLKGFYTGFRRRIPEQVGQAMEFTGIAPETGKAIKGWAREGEDPAEKGMFTQAGEMIPASSAIPMGMNVTGDLLTKIPHPYARLAGYGVKGLSYVAAPLLFGLSQAQSTVESGDKQVKKLKDQIKAATDENEKTVLSDELSRVEENLKWAPYATGGIEALGETFGNMALLRLLGPLAGKAVMGGLKGVMKPTLGRFAKELAFKTLPTEIATEMGQGYTEGLVEKKTGIRPDTNPWEEAVGAIGPTAIMTLLTGGGGRMLQSHVANNYMKDLSSPETDPQRRQTIADSIGHMIETDYNDANMAGQWTRYANNKIAAGEAIDPDMMLDKESLSPSLENVIKDAEKSTDNIDDMSQKIVDDLAASDPIALGKSFDEEAKNFTAKETGEKRYDIMQALYSSLDANDDKGQGMTPLLIDEYVSRGGVIPASRIDLARKYPDATYEGSYPDHSKGAREARWNVVELQKKARETGVPYDETVAEKAVADYMDRYPKELARESKIDPVHMGMISDKATFDKWWDNPESIVKSAGTIRADENAITPDRYENDKASPEALQERANVMAEYNEAKKLSGDPSRYYDAINLAEKHLMEWGMKHPDALQEEERQRVRKGMDYLAQSLAGIKPTKEAKKPKTIPPKSLFRIVQLKGGIEPKGFDRQIEDLGKGGEFIFKQGGSSLDYMYRTLLEEGFIPPKSGVYTGNNDDYLWELMTKDRQGILVTLEQLDRQIEDDIMNLEEYYAQALSTKENESLERGDVERVQREANALVEKERTHQTVEERLRAGQSIAEEYPDVFVREEDETPTEKTPSQLSSDAVSKAPATSKSQEAEKTPPAKKEAPQQEDLTSKSISDLVADAFSIINDHIGERGSISGEKIALDDTLYNKLKPILAEIARRAKEKALDVKSYLFGAVDAQPEGKAKAFYEAAAGRYTEEEATPKPVNTLLDKEPPGGWTEADKVPDKYRKTSKVDKPETSDILNNKEAINDSSDIGSQRNDTGSLEGTPSKDVRGPVKKRAARKRSNRGGNKDTGSLLGDREKPDSGGIHGRPGAEDGVGTRQGGVDTSAERGGSTESDEESGIHGSAEQSKPAANSRNYRITEASEIGKGSLKEKFQANITAIKLLKQLDEEKREATAEEKDTLARYVGWGGMPQAFDQYNRDWRAQREELEKLITPEELISARASTLNAHYTSPEVIGFMWKALEKMGFKSGRIIEPAMGVGHFFGMIPSEIAAKSKLTGVELDATSGKISKYLYPDADIRVQGYETVTIPDNFYDVAISNVPFGDYKLYDPQYRKHSFSIHNYFFAKAIDKVRPGGIVAFITSRYTMDAYKANIREYLSDRADLVAAFRLPNTAFKGNANTEVVTDVIVLQKRAEGQTENKGAQWIKLEDVTDKKGQEYSINEYFIAHPDNMLGVPSLKGSMYSDNEFTLEPSGKPFNEDLERAMAALPDNIVKAAPRQAKDVTKKEAKILPAPGDVKEGAFSIVDGKAYMKEGENLVPQEMAAPMIAKIKGMIDIRDAVRALLRKEMNSTEDSFLKPDLAALNRLYDRFVDKHGRLTARVNKSAYRIDPDYPLLASLEIVNVEDGSIKKADIFSKRVVSNRPKIDHVDTAKEALVVSMSELGELDFDRMSYLTGKSEEDLQTELAGQALIFKNPSGAWETADEYLTGNVREKLVAAESATKADPQYAPNIEALKAVQPKDLDYNEIEARLGSSWIPTTDVAAFVNATLGIGGNAVKVRYSAAIGTWVLDVDRNELWRIRQNVNNSSTWGTGRYGAIELIDDALNSRIPTVRDPIPGDPNGRTVVNPKETEAAREKQYQIKEKFKAWLWEDEGRRERLVKKYNQEFNNIRIRQFDGSHIVLPGIATGVTLRPHQKNAIWRILQSGNTLLAHVVGAGKTFTMVGAAMETRRLGLAKKPMFTVPNHLIEQWGSEFMRLYPTANILVAGKDDFTPLRRQTLMSRIATGDWDAVIVAHSGFERLPMSMEAVEKHMTAQIDDLAAHIRAEKGENPGSRIIKELEKAKKRLEEKLKRRLNLKQKDKVVDFEELGVDALYVDEAHMFKNLFFTTRMTRVAGLPNTESNRAFDMYMKTQYLFDKTKGKGVVFATGTPISNSMAEMFTMQRYLQPNTLRDYGIQNFDAWAKNFGEVVSALEIAPDGSGYRVRTRFAKFTNLPELLNLYRQVADVQTADMLKLPVPDIRTGKPETTIAKGSEQLKAYVETLVKRAEKIRNGHVDPREDNMLNVTNDGRKAALDMRLVGHQEDTEHGKVNLAVRNIHDIWERTTKQKSAQLVFLDLSTPSGKGFNLYNDIKDKLLRLGMPKEQIAYIHDADTDAKKLALFDKVNGGKVRILMGSTEKMGAGMNVQRKLAALHHLDAPWRPSDIEQREGRIVRQGNENKEVEIHRYATEGSFDAYMWQTLETKARFIAQTMTSDASHRSAEDIDGTALTFAEVKALASGNPMVMEKIKVDTEIKRLGMLHSQWQSSKYAMQKNLSTLPSRISFATDRIGFLEKDLKTRVYSDKFSMKIGGKVYDERVKAGDKLVILAAQMELDDTKQIGSYSGFPITLTRTMSGLALTAEGELSHKSGSTEHGTGAIQSIDYQLRHIGDVIASLKEDIVEYEKTLKATKEEIDKPFQHTEKLNELKAQQTKINKALDLDKHDDHTATLTPDTDLDKTGVHDIESPYGKASDILRESGETKAADNRAGKGTLRQPEVVSEEVGKYKVHSTEVKNNEDVAQIAHNLVKDPQEQFIAILTDADDKVVVVHRYSRGETDSTYAHPHIIGHALSTKGVKNIWLAHNHPSQSASLSMQDHQILKRMQNVAEESGVEVRDVIAVTATEYGTAKKVFTYQVQGQKTTVPVVERRYFRIPGTTGKKIIDNESLVAVGKRVIPKGGIILVDARNVAVGTITVPEYGKLRGETQARLLKEADKRNATGAFIYEPTRTINMAEAQNIINLANEARFPIRDIYDATGSMTYKGMLPKAGAVFFRKDTTYRQLGPYSPEFYHADALKKIMAPFLSKFPEAVRNNIEIIQGNRNFPEDFIRRAGGSFNADQDRIYGAYDPATDKIYIVADGIRDPRDAEKTVIEELIGHKGLSSILTKHEHNLVKFSIYHQFKGTPEMNRIIKDYGLNDKDLGDMSQAGEEYMVHHMSKVYETPSLWKKIVAYIRSALRRYGLVNKFSDTDIQVMMDRAAKLLTSERGKEDVEDNLPSMSKLGIADAFYSQLVNTVQYKLNEMPSKAQSVIPWLQKNQVKPMELEEMGVEKWLRENQKDGKIDKAAFAQWVKDNQVEVKEITKKDGKPRIPFEGWTDDEIRSHLQDLTGYTAEETEAMPIETVKAEIQEIEGDVSDEVSTNTKFAQYKLPGGSNYREVLFTLPIDQNKAHEVHSKRLAELIARRDQIEAQPRSEERERQYRNVQVQIDLVMRQSDDKYGVKYTSPHWSEPNVLGHVRMQDFTDTEGNKVLLVEEVQSDWHQQGKKEGYMITSLPDSYEVISNDSNTLWAVRKKGEQDYITSSIAKKDAISKALSILNQQTVPPAPFRENWQEYLMKRILRMAAENGYSKLAWTTGEQQAERYDLSKVIDSIGWHKHNGDKFWTAYKDDKALLSGNMAEAEASIGKELAAKIANDDGETGVVEGLDLKVGGEGMKSFYDQKLPGFMNRYVKQWAAKVETANINPQQKQAVFDTKEEADAFTSVNQDKGYTTKYEPRHYAWSVRDKDGAVVKTSIEATSVHSIPITPAMKEAVLYEGQPLYKKEASVEIKLVKNEPFNFQRINSQRFLYNARTREMVLGGNDISKSTHAEDHGIAGAQGGFDDFIRGWMGKGKNYPEGIIHFAPRVSKDYMAENPDYADDVLKTLEYFIRSGANKNTILRSYPGGYEQRFGEAAPAFFRPRPLFSKESEPTATDTADDFKTKLTDQAHAVIYSVAEKSKSPIWREIFGSPEWVNHPVIKSLVKIFTDVRTEKFHNYFNDFIEADKEVNIVDELHSLRYKGMSVAQKISAMAFGQTSKEYKMLEKVIDNGDVHHITPEKMEEWFVEHHTPADVVHTWRRLRGSWDKALDIMQTQIKESIKKHKEHGGVVDSGSIYETLQKALEEMSKWKGSYAPRSRPVGDYVLQATTGEGDNKQYFRNHGSAREMYEMAEQMKRKGWATTVAKLSRLPESTYQNVKTVETANLIENALRGLKNDPALAAELSDEIVQLVADTIRARGYRQTMIHRGEKLITGYVTDPLERYLKYINSISGGLSKAEVAQQAMKEFQSIDPAKDSRLHDTALAYIQENLRNMEPMDRLLGLAKSIATFKFLGFNLRSLGVNLTAVATTAPAAIHQYALGGKGNLGKIGTALGIAGKDFGQFMITGKAGNAAEQAFLDKIKKSGYDDPQYTRDATARLQKVHGQAWNMIMSASMWMFGKSEQWNRGTTMLAAYRLAREQGMTVDDATAKAREASNRAHGIYGKGTLPSWATGNNVGAKVGQAMYTYGKFGHNYVQMLVDLLKKENIAGTGKRNVAAFTWALMSPMVVAGAAVLPFRKEIMGLISGILRALGIMDDPEKWWWDQVRRYLGETAETAGRHGLTGLAGVDISGSLSVGVGIPKELWDLTGPLGGVYDDLVKAKTYMMSGQASRAIEKALPTGLANPFRAYREAITGVKTEKGNTIWDKEGKPMKLTGGEAAARVVGFRGTRQVIAAEQAQEIKGTELRFDERRKKIYEEVRAYFADPDRTPAQWSSVWSKVKKFNEDIISSGMKPTVSFITPVSLHQQAKNVAVPTKKERGRIQLTK